MSIELSIVIPTYNEAPNIRILLQRIDAAMKGIKYECVVVDDNSPDKTWEAAEGEATKYPVRVIRRTTERGLASAVVRGMREAKGAFICVMDSDLSHPPEVIPRLLKKAHEGGADAVVASRYMKEGAVEEWPLHRKIISMGATILAKPVISVSDPMSGFFLVKRAKLDFESIRPIGYKIMLETLIKSRISSIAEVPYVFTNRAAGRSNLGMKQYMEYVVQLKDLYYYRATHSDKEKESK
jgi:dolichol-phosphate mannosyltransferase